MHFFKNFKNFADAEIDLSKPMTILIGRNGSGKSNLIEGVELLGELLNALKINEISDLDQGGKLEIRGNFNGCFHQNKQEFTIGFKDDMFFDDKNKKINCFINANLELPKKFSKQIKIDDIDSVELLFQKTKDKGLNNSDVDMLFLAFLIGSLELLDSSNLAGSFIINATVLSANNKQELLNESRKKYLFLLNKYNENYVFDIYPRAMRKHSSIGLNQLSKNGSNLSSVLYYLHQNKPEILEEKILKNIKGLPEEDIEIFDFITTSDNSDVLVALKYTNGQVISAKLLSDGTLRALAILTALETVPEGSRIIIEEIDNGIHASRVNVLLNAIWESSNRRNLHTLITTHNTATLDDLSEEQLDGVVVCHYDKASQSAKLTPFFEIPNVDMLLQKGKLGDLVIRNAIERYLDPDFEKQRKEKMKSWLESIE